MTFRHYMFLVICLLILVGSGCAVSSPPTTIVCGTCEGTSRFVRLQKHSSPSVSDSQGGFSHPLKLNSEDWIPILASIRVRAVVNFLRKGKEAAAFTPEEVDYLSMTLSRAFAKASPEQWVVFGLSNPSSAYGNHMTTGGWYVEGNLLHLLLPNFHAPVSMVNLRQALDRDPMLNVLEGRRYEFLHTEFTHPHKDPGDQSLLSFLMEETPHLVMDYQRLLPGASDSKEILDEKGKGALLENSDGSVIPPSNIEERLATLKQLKDKELITEEDYQRRKKELLNQL